MTSTPNTKDDLIARADEQIARTYEQIARADEQLARMSEQFSKWPDAVHDPSVGSAAQPPHGRLARPGLMGLLSAVCIVGIVFAVVLQSSRRGDADWRPMGAAAHFNAILAMEKPAVSCTTRSIARSSDGGEGSAAASSTVVPHWNAGRRYGCPAASELTHLLQKITGDIANLERAIEQLKSKQDQIASDNATAIEQLKTKQEDMARLLAKISEQSAAPKTSPPSAGPTQSPQATMRPQAPPRRQYPPRWYPPRWQYYDDGW